MTTSAGDIEYTVDANVKPLLSSFTEVEKAVDKYGNELTKADKAAGRFIDKSGKMREANGRFVKSTELATRKTKKFGGGVKNLGLRISEVSGFVKTGVTAVLAMNAAITATALAVSAAAKELDILAKQSNVSVEEFQQLAIAAKSVGVEQDKLGDIFKDSQDKIGDFLSTGGGELADFFDLIAPKVGLTAKEFEGLSGPQILGKFQQALDDANVSAAKQVFFLESLADEASRLRPVFQNGGEAINKAAQRLDELGGAITQKQINDLKEISRAFSDVGTVSQTELSKLVAEIKGPLIGSLEATIKTVRLFGRTFREIFGIFTGSNLQRKIDSLADGFEKLGSQRLGERIEFTKNKIKELEQVDTDFARREIEGLNTELDALNIAAERLKPIKIEVTRGVGDGDDISADDNDKIQRRLDAVRAGLDKEMALQIQFQQRIADIRAASGAGLLTSPEAMQLEKDAAKNLADSVVEIYKDAAKETKNTWQEALSRVDETGGNAFAATLAQTRDFEDSVKAGARAVGTDLVGALIKFVAQQAIAKAAQLAGITAITGAQVASGAAITGVMAPAAAATSVATAGAAPALGLSALAAAIPAALALFSAPGRQTGGRVSPGQPYRVNESGVPELFTDPLGNQMMIAANGGKVTSPANIDSSGIQVNFNVVNQVGGAEFEVQSVNRQPDSVTINAIVRDVQTGNGPVSRALKSNTNIQRRPK